MDLGVEIERNKPINKSKIKIYGVFPLNVLLKGSSRFSRWCLLIKELSTLLQRNFPTSEIKGTAFLYPLPPSTPLVLALQKKSRNKEPPYGDWWSLQMMSCQTLAEIRIFCEKSQESLTRNHLYRSTVACREETQMYAGENMVNRGVDEQHVLRI